MSVIFGFIAATQLLYSLYLEPLKLGLCVNVKLPFKWILTLYTWV